MHGKLQNIDCVWVLSSGGDSGQAGWVSVKYVSQYHVTVCLGTLEVRQNLKLKKMKKKKNTIEVTFICGLGLDVLYLFSYKLGFPI